MTILAAPNTDMKPSEICDKAIKVLKKRGWYQGGFSDGTPNGPVCIIGAINVARGVPPSGSGVMSFPYVVRVEIELQIWESIASWNDSKGRKLEDVLKLLKTCSKSLKAKGL